MVLLYLIEAAKNMQGHPFNRIKMRSNPNILFTILNHDQRFFYSIF